MEPVSWHDSGTWNIEVATRFFKKLLDPVLSQRFSLVSFVISYIVGLTG
jgi:hypothetical protein